jgi:hypothetical protein
MSENDFSYVTRVRHSLIRPPNSTHPPVAGACVFHGRNSHLQEPTLLPRGSFTIAPSMIRYPVHLSVSTHTSASDSLSSGRRKHSR